MVGWSLKKIIQGHSEKRTEYIWQMMLEWLIAYGRNYFEPLLHITHIINLCKPYN